LTARIPWNTEYQGTFSIPNTEMKNTISPSTIQGSLHVIYSVLLTKDGDTLTRGVVKYLTTLYSFNSDLIKCLWGCGIINHFFKKNRWFLKLKNFLFLILHSQNGILICCMLCTPSFLPYIIELYILTLPQ